MASCFILCACSLIYYTPSFSSVTSPLLDAPDGYPSAYPTA
jgi:hypothetical protein